MFNQEQKHNHFSAVPAPSVKGFFQSTSGVSATRQEISCEVNNRNVDRNAQVLDELHDCHPRTNARTSHTITSSSICCHSVDFNFQFKQVAQEWKSCSKWEWRSKEANKAHLHDSFTVIKHHSLTLFHHHIVFLNSKLHLSLPFKSSKNNNNKTKSTNLYTYWVGISLSSSGDLLALGLINGYLAWYFLSSLRILYHV